jgi:predicted nucleic acid-binding Zn ribbon protein
MTCAVCGTALPVGANRCPRCGTFVEAPPSSGGDLPPTMYAPVNHGTPQPPPGNYPQANQGASQVPPTVYAPAHQHAPQMPRANPGAPYPSAFQPPYNAGMPANPNVYQQQGVPPLSQGVPPLPPQYMHSTGNDNGSGKKKNRMLMVGLIALVVILLVGAIPILLANHGGTPQNKQATNTTATTGTTQNKPATAVATKASSSSNPLPNEKNPYPPGTGMLVLKDPMRDNSHGYMWQEGTTNGTTCRFTSGQYHVTKASGSALCIPQSPAITLQNLTFEANLTLQSGTYMGLATRIDPQRGTGYLFVIGTDGTYAINKVNIKATGSGQVQQISQGFSPSLPMGANQVKMAVVMRGTQLSLFVNDQPIISINDSKLNNAGGIGVFVNGNSALNLAVSNVRVWKL